MADQLEDVTEKEWCPACGLHHDVVEGQSVRPVLCHNVLELASALRDFVESGFDEDQAQEFLGTMDEILGCEDEDEDEDEDIFE